VCVVGGRGGCGGREEGGVMLEERVRTKGGCVLMGGEKETGSREEQKSEGG